MQSAICKNFYCMHAVMLRYLHRLFRLNAIIGYGTNALILLEYLAKRNGDKSLLRK